MPTNYSKNRTYLQNLIDEYNKTSTFKVSKNLIISDLDSAFNQVNQMEPDVNDPEYKTKYAAYKEKCYDLFYDYFKSQFDSNLESMDKAVRSGKLPLDENSLKKYNTDLGNLKGLLYTLCSYSFLDHLDEKKELQEKAKQDISHHSFNKRNVYDFDGNEFDLRNSSLGYTENERIQASNYSIKNLSGYVDHKANMIRDGRWHAQTCKNELTSARESIDNNCSRDSITDLIYKYKALEEKHNNRFLLSRLWHSKEQKELDDTKRKLEDLMKYHNDLNIRGHNDEKLEEWMARSTNPSYAFGYLQGGIINDKGIADYEKKIAAHEKKEKEIKVENEAISKNISTKEYKKQQQKNLIDMCEKAYSMLNGHEMPENTLNEIKHYKHTADYEKFLNSCGFDLIKKEGEDVEYKLNPTEFSKLRSQIENKKGQALDIPDTDIEKNASSKNENEIIDDVPEVVNEGPHMNK